MAADFPALDAFQGFIYAALTVASLGVLGMTAEVCDLSVDCPGRAAAAIAFAVVVSLLALVMFIAYAFELSFLKRIEIFLVLAILIFNIVETSLASSPRNTASSSFIAELSWWGLLLALAAFFLALSSGDRPKFDIAVKQHDTETPLQPAAPAYTATTTSSQPVQQPYTPETAATPPPAAQ